MTNDLLYQLALTRVPHIGHVHAKILAQQLGSAEAIFKAKLHQLEQIEGIGTVRANAIKSFNNFTGLEPEIALIEKYKINTFFLTEAAYPQRLLHCYDPPALLFYRGQADLNTSRIVSIIGTRGYTSYGKQVTEKWVKELAAPDILIVSGLAFGIDAIAHKSAIKNNIPTVGVLAHGLDTIYPPEHTALAKDIIKHQGGLLTEYPFNTRPEKHNFPTRNRIVAGLSDAVIVIETGIKGGSMITAGLANSYNKDVFALPGKATDATSAGCNYLIRNNRAILMTDVCDLLQEMGWEEKNIAKKKMQKEIFIELSEPEKKIVQLLGEKETVHIDEINLKSGLAGSAIAAAILNLELCNIISSLPGKMYRLL